MKDPAVSVCIPAYQGASHLRAAIESVLAQGFENWEIALSDDASGDETYEIARSFRDPRIRATRRPVNAGLVANFQKSLEMARAPWILFLPQDDVLFPETLERLRARAGDAAFAFGGVRYVGESGGEFVPDLPERMAGEEYCRRSLEAGLNFTHFPACLIRRKALEEAGGLDLGVGIFFDWNAYLRMALGREVAYERSALAGVGLHRARATLRLGSAAAQAAELIRAFRGAVPEDLARRGAARVALRYAALPEGGAGKWREFWGFLALPGAPLPARLRAAGRVLRG